MVAGGAAAPQQLKPKKTAPFNWLAKEDAGDAVQAGGKSSQGTTPNASILAGPERKPANFRKDPATGKVNRYTFRSAGSGNSHPVGRKAAKKKEAEEQKDDVIVLKTKRPRKRKTPFQDPRKVVKEEEVDALPSLGF